ncbi:MAG TPA: TolC family protein [Acidiferrobacteraceae bacterium]|nr:TolC family protein [Acidiferrobacteraceae bacterium]
MKKAATIVLVTSLWIQSGHAEGLTIEQVLQQVVDYYPSIKGATLQVERAKQDNLRVQSQLGWQLALRGGATREYTLLGTTVDTLRTIGNLSKLTRSGSTLGLQVERRRDESAITVLPTLPNPLNTTNVDISYRVPLGKGKGNPAYAEGLTGANVSLLLAQAEEQRLYDQLAVQVIDLHLAAKTTLERIHNTEQSLDRTQRLQKYIKSKSGLGIAEDKDLLQVAAQLNNQRAQLKALEMAWAQQEISLNRLMGRPWNSRFEPKTVADTPFPGKGFDGLFKEVAQHSPSLTSAQARLTLADSTIKTQRDSRKDKLDLVMTLGKRSRVGITAGGSSYESDDVGSINIEFTRSLDKRGLNAQLYQARLDRSIAIQDKQQTLNDLRYELASLLAEFRIGQTALEAYYISLKSEHAKLNEALSRYKQGRTDTSQLIQFENELSATALALALHRIELQRRYYKLVLLRGQLWKGIVRPTMGLPGVDVEDEQKG